ncbi:MAG: hypothetical protein JSS02_23010 [Planctomycetes bacterium]|nr:hypothetical protein [Planctomycetota bacterium]
MKRDLEKLGGGVRSRLESQLRAGCCHHGPARKRTAWLSASIQYNLRSHGFISPEHTLSLASGAPQ